MKIIAVVNNKGGVGKTATVRNLSGYNAEQGRQTLVVDLDGQGNATTGLGCQANGAAAAVLRGQAKLLDVIQTNKAVPGLYVLAGGASLNSLTMPWKDDEAGVDNVGVFMDMARNLQQAIQDLDQLARSQGTVLDMVTIDHGPNLSGLMEVALTVANLAIIPINMAAESLQGHAVMVERIDAARAERNPGLVLLGALINDYDQKKFQQALFKSSVKALNKDGKKGLMMVVIGNNDSIKESAMVGLPVTKAFPSSPGARYIRALWREIDFYTPEA
jgi:chromosome partitioning protein